MKETYLTAQYRRLAAGRGMTIEPYSAKPPCTISHRGPCASTMSDHFGKPPVLASMGFAPVLCCWRWGGLYGRLRVIPVGF
jgi:hypothetical protein